MTLTDWEKGREAYPYLYCHLPMTNWMQLIACLDLTSFLTRFNKIATQGAPQMAVDKEANSLSRVYSYYSKFNLRLFYV